MLSICLSFDYELFLGKNFATPKEVLFDRAESIANTILCNGGKATFFADVCSVEAHRKHGKMDYVAQFEQQIKDFIHNGHDVQLHIHPNWLFSSVENNQIIPGSKGYRLHEFGFSEGLLSAQTIIRNEIDYLDGICKSANDSYKCIAYRAGGFALQPEESILKELMNEGILIDSSIVPGMKSDSINAYNYMRVPKNQNWWIEPLHGINQPLQKSSGRVFEVPVATARPRLWELIGKKREELSLPPSKRLGEYASLPNCPKKRQSYLIGALHRLFDYRYISLDTRYYQRILDDLAYFNKKTQNSGSNRYIALIGHPKLADKSRVENIGLLVQAIQKDSRYRIVTMRDIYEEIKEGLI